MSPARRRTGTPPASDHARARGLAAERLSEALPSRDAAWLDIHLESCAACRSVADAYAAQALELRSLPQPDPPRDLWARTAAALDAEDRRSSRSRRGARQRRRSYGPSPFGALAGAMVVVVVVGAALLADRGMFAPGPGGSAGPGTLATPLTIAAQDVAWLSPQQDGTYALNFARLDRVCPATAAPDCAPLDASARTVITLTAAPRAVLRSPAQSQFVVVDAATTNVGGTVYVVPVGPPGEASPSGTSPTPLVIASAAPGDTVPTTLASGSPVTGPTLDVPVPPSPAASDDAIPAGTAVPPAARSEAPASVAPSDGVAASLPASPEPEASQSPSAAKPGDGPDASPSAGADSIASPPGSGAPDAGSPEAGSPSPSAGPSEPIAIITGVVVVGETAAYSPDGSWFAFTARPADGSQGPDIYVWHAGDLTARPITTDHASIFSSWLGDRILGSRPAADDLVFEPAPTPGTSPAVGESASPAPSSSAEPTPSAEGGVVIGDAPPALSSLPRPTGSPSTTASTATPDPTPSTPDSSPSAPVASDTDSASTPPSDAPSPPDAASPSVEAGASVSPSPSAFVSGPIPSIIARPVSFVIDPATDLETPMLGAPAWRPTVDPSGRWVVYWSGSIGYDETTRTWAPFEGSLLIAPVEWVAGSAMAAVMPSPTAETSSSPSPSLDGAGGSTTPDGGSGGTGLDAGGGSPSATLSPEPTSSIASTQAPEAIPTAFASPTASGSEPGNGEAGPTASASTEPSESAGPSPSPLPPLTGPEPLLSGDPTAPAPAQLRDWDVRFDPTDSRLAIWAGDPVDQAVGRLSLLSFEPTTGRITAAASLLADQPALVGFSLEAGRLVWATPPGQDGEGSRLQVLAWQGDGSGRLTSESATGRDTVVVVR